MCVYNVFKYQYKYIYIYMYTCVCVFTASRTPSLEIRIQETMFSFKKT